MGWVNYRRHAEVVLDASKSDRDRTWALRSCCYAVASIAHSTITTNELVTAIAQRAGCETEIRASDKFVIINRLERAIALLAKLREALLCHLREYDAARRSAKTSGKRFPVPAPFSDGVVMQILARL
jgi:hypothetical protein